MGTKTDPTSEPQAAPAANVLPQPQTPPAEPKYVTLEDAQKLVTEAVKAAKAEMMSYSDKGREKVSKAVQEVQTAIATLRSQGQAISPEDEAKMIQNASVKAIAQPETPPPAQAAPEPKQAQQTDDPILMQAQQILSEIGVQFAEGDPEIAAIKTDGTAWQYLKSIEAAALAKKARLNPTAGTPAPAVPSGAGRVPAQQGTKPPANLTPDEKISQGLKQANWGSQGPAT